MVKNHKILILGSVFALAIITIIGFSNTKNGKEQTKANFEISNINIAERTCLYLNEELLIGNNEQELENGYYDVKIKQEQGELLIYFNKLWYTKCDEDYIEEEYLAKICRELAKLFENTEGEELEYQLYKYVKEQFNKVKNNITVEILELDDIIISAQHEQGMCKLIIKRV